MKPENQGKLPKIETEAVKAEKNEEFPFRNRLILSSA